MASYYVSTSRGNNSTGTGTASNPWLTIAKAIAGTPAITLSGGDTLYVEPGVYRETVTLALTPSAVNWLAIVGDVDGAGFLAGGYATPATGVVTWTNYLTNDTTAASSNPALNANGRNYVTLRKFKMIAGNTSILLRIDGTNWTIEDNILIIGNNSTQYNIRFYGTAGTPPNLIIRRNLIWNLSFGVSIQVDAPLHTSEYAGSVVIERNLITNFNRYGMGIILTPTGTGAFWMGGTKIQNNTFLITGVGVQTFFADPLAAPILSYGNLFIGVGVAYSMGGTGQVTDNGSVLACNGIGTNATAGANTTIAGVAPTVDFHDCFLGLPSRPLFEPLAGSYIAGWGSYGTPGVVDGLGRTSPEGGHSTLPAAGWIERHDTMTKDTFYPDGGSGACGKLVGPSSQERPVLVDAQATTISVKVRWDGNHGDASKPQAFLLANAEVGVAGQTVTAQSAGGTGSIPNAYETLTFTPITPSAAGVVMLRMVSRAASGNGMVYFDSIALS